MAKAHVMTPARRAALRKAQLASAKKRKRGALVRNTGRGLVGKRNGSRKTRYKVARYAGGVAGAAALAYGAHKLSQHASKKGKYVPNRSTSRSDFRTAQSRMKYKSTHAPHVKLKPRGRTASGPANKHNRVFVTNKYGKTSVRKRTH